MNLHERTIKAEAEADRLLGIRLHIHVLTHLLALSRHVDFQQAGEEAVLNGLVTEADWLVIKQV